MPFRQEVSSSSMSASPTEQDNADTTKVDLLLPDGFVTALYAPVPGWTAKVITKKLATPVQTDDGPVSEEVKETDPGPATGRKGRSHPGSSRTSPCRSRFRGRPERRSTFKALQTYSNGEVVRWIGAPGSDTPAPQVKVTASAESDTAATGGQTTAASKTTAAESDGSDNNGLALGLGIAGLVVGLAALVLVLVRRRSST